MGPGLGFICMYQDFREACRRVVHSSFSISK